MCLVCIHGGMMTSGGEWGLDVWPSRPQLRDAFFMTADARATQRLCLCSPSETLSLIWLRRLHAASIFQDAIPAEHVLIPPLSY